MATIRAYTTIEQSKVLAKILPIESADMWWNFYSVTTDDTTSQIIHIDTPWVGTFNWNNEPDNIPCWSLAALLEVLPNKIISHETAFEDEDAEDINYTYYKHLEVTEDDHYMCYYKEIDIKYDCYADNPIDACYEMIIKLYELKML